MLLPGSRYAGGRPFSPPVPGGADLLRPREVRTLPGVVEHTLAAGDRPDLLAHHYYGDARLWWRILDANPQLVCGSDMWAKETVEVAPDGTERRRNPMEGRVIVIPAGRD
jgi:nucleoid-associated protein YgaU